jgi:hypothetical protein
MACSAQATLVSFDADSFADYENMHQPVPEIFLWRSTYHHRWDKLYDKIFAVPSTDNLLGQRSIGWILSPAEGYQEWWNEEPSLYIEIDGLAKSFRLSTKNRPNWLRKTCIVDCYDEDGIMVAHNFQNTGSTFTTDTGQYNIASISIWTSGQMSLDNFRVDMIPEPATLLLFGFGAVLLRKKTTVIMEG